MNTTRKIHRKGPKSKKSSKTAKAKVHHNNSVFNTSPLRRFLNTGYYIDKDDTEKWKDPKGLDPKRTGALGALPQVLVTQNMRREIIRRRRNRGKSFAHTKKNNTNLADFMSGLKL